MGDGFAYDGCAQSWENRKDKLLREMASTHLFCTPGTCSARTASWNRALMNSKHHNKCITCGTCYTLTSVQPLPLCCHSGQPPMTLASPVPTLRTPEQWGAAPGAECSHPAAAGPLVLMSGTTAVVVMTGMLGTRPHTQTVLRHQSTHDGKPAPGPDGTSLPPHSMSPGT